MRVTMGFIIAASLLACAGVSSGGDLGTEIDLTTFGHSNTESFVTSADTAVGDVGPGSAVADRRFYISGMLGPSFSRLAVDGGEGGVSLSKNDSLLAAGGAFGVAFERRNGRLRVETEGMGRDTYFGEIESDGVTSLGYLAGSNWSVMQNVWRDVMLTKRFGAYGGGGIGAGGYRFGVGTKGSGGIEGDYDAARTAFAWQAGGGLIYEISDRLTFDVGYRYFSIGSITSGAGRDATVSDFTASELMFGLRFYEPFRGLMR